MENGRVNQVFLLESTNDFCVKPIQLALLQYFFLNALVQLRNTAFQNNK
jgi:hypothetical protein